MNSYTIAPVMPTLFVGIRNTENIKTVLFTGLLIVTILFGIIGACGYLGWGSSILNYNSQNIGNTNLVISTDSTTILNLNTQNII